MFLWSAGHQPSPASWFRHFGRATPLLVLQSARWLACGSLSTGYSAIRAGEFDEDRSTWPRLTEDPTRHRRKTAADAARPSCFTTPVLCHFPVPAPFTPSALVGERPLSWGYVPRARRYTGIVSCPPRLLITTAGLVSPYSTRTRTYTHCLLRPDLYALFPSSRRLIIACFTPPPPLPPPRPVDEP